MWPPKLLYEIMISSQPATVSNLFVELGKNIAADSYDQPTFSVDLLCKDVRLATEMAKAHGAPPPLAGVIQFLNEAAQTQGFGAQDTSVMWKALGAFWKQEAEPQCEVLEPARRQVLLYRPRKVLCANSGLPPRPWQGEP